MATDAADHLLRHLRRHNPWWESGRKAFALPPRRKSDFYHLARPDDAGSQFEDQALLALVGRRGVGKTTLLQSFVHHRIDAGDSPERFCYLPFDADPRYQLRSDEQLRRAVQYYEGRILSRAGANGPHFLLLDDVNRITHATKPDVEGWGTPVSALLEGRSDRHVVVTASAGVQIERELERVGFPGADYDVQPILPEKFRDHVFGRHPDLEATERTRISPTSLWRGPASLPVALERATLEPFLAELVAKHAQVAHLDARIQSLVVEYLAMGGILSFTTPDDVETVADLSARQYARLREDVRQALYQEVPGFDTIETIDDLERLCAIAARDAGREPMIFRELVDLFDVDRRTITESYLPALGELYLLTGITEYDNERPRAVRLYLRDPGLAIALAHGNAETVLGDFEREADLARLVAFDHTMRFAYNVNAAQDRDVAPTVQYWRDGDREVDFVFEIDGTPVPVGLAYRPGDRERTLAALEAFRETYDVPIAFRLVGDTDRGEEAVRELEDGIVQLPYWLYLLLC